MSETTATAPVEAKAPSMTAEQLKTELAKARADYTAIAAKVTKKNNDLVKESRGVEAKVREEVGKKLAASKKELATLMADKLAIITTIHNLERAIRGKPAK